MITNLCDVFMTLILNNTTNFNIFLTKIASKKYQD